MELAALIVATATLIVDVAILAVLLTEFDRKDCHGA